MKKMDERAQAELYKINQETFFISVLVVVVFLYVKIIARADILSMLGELVAGGIVLLYLVPYFVIRCKYRVLDEMVRKKLYLLSTLFLSVELLSMVVLIFVDIFITADKVFSSKALSEVKITDFSLPFIIALILITSVYSLVRRHNEKFVGDKAAELNLKEYNKRLIIRAAAASLSMILLIVAFSVINNRISGTDKKLLLFLLEWIHMGIIWCILGIPASWCYYFYYLGRRKKLEQKIGCDGQE